VVVAVTQCDRVTPANRPIDQPAPVGELVSDVVLVDDLSACDPKRSIEPFREAIENALAQRSAIREGKVSPELKSVRDIVERELPKVALVPVKTFREWCRECKVPNDQQADVIRDILHHMGSLFYFGRDRLEREREHKREVEWGRELTAGQRRLHKLQPDTVLSEYVINPVWLKHATYRVFEESERGEWLTRETVHAKVREADAKCKKHKRGGDVIEAFLKLVELSFFDEEKQQYLLPRGLDPGLLPGYEDWPTATLTWDFVPESAFHRFLVRMHHRKQVATTPKGGYAHGRDWVMVQHHQCRVVVSADPVNGVIELRFAPKSSVADRSRAFDFIRDLLAGDFIGKEPTGEERLQMPDTGPPSQSPPVTPRRRGRPVQNATSDDHIFAAWCTGEYTTYAALARELNLTVPDSKNGGQKPNAKLVERVVNRVQKRRKKSAESEFGQEE